MTWRRAALRSAAVAAASFALGGLTSFAQGALPEALVPFANSASGWTVLTAVLIGWSRVRTGLAAALGATSFVLLVLGYAAVSAARDLYYDPMLFGVVGLAVGPFVGIAASWLRRDPWRAAVGTALLAGIGAGESVYGLTTVVDTTGPTYWVIAGVGAVALVVVMLARRVRTAGPVLVATLGASAVAAAFVFAYTWLGGGVNVG